MFRSTSSGEGRSEWLMHVGVGKAPLVRPILSVAGVEEYVFLRSGSQHVSEARLALHFGGPALNMFPDVRLSIHFFDRLLTRFGGRPSTRL